MKLFLLLTGQSQRIFDSNGFNSDEFEVIKLDEKLLSEPGKIFDIIRKSNFEEIYFGCKELILQRFHTFMKYYIARSPAKKGGIIDEFGNKNLYSPWKFLFCEIPNLLFEAIASTIIIIYYHIKLPLIRWTLYKKR